MSKLHVKTGDNVVIIAGKDKGKKGKILSAMPKTHRVIVEGANMITRHVKPMGAKSGGRITKEGTIDSSNVMLICSKCGKATRVAHQIKDDKKVRICKKCGAVID